MLHSQQYYPDLTDAKIQKKMHYIQLYWYRKLNKNQNNFYFFLCLRFGGRWHSSVDTRLFPFTSRPTPQWSPLRPSALHSCIFYCVNEHWSYSTKTNNNNKRKQYTVVFQGKVHCIVAFSIALMSTVPTRPKQTINECTVVFQNMSNCIFAFHYVDDRCSKSTQSDLKISKIFPL